MSDEQLCPVQMNRSDVSLAWHRSMRHRIRADHGSDEHDDADAQAIDEPAHIACVSVDPR